MVLRHSEGVIKVPDNHASKFKWLTKLSEPVNTDWLDRLNKPVNIDWLNKLKEPPKRYHGGLTLSQDPMLNHRRFEEEQNLLRNKAIEELQRVFEEKEVEKLRRHDERIYYLSELLKDSRNAIEQRDAIIRFMVEQMVNSEQSKEVKKKLLMDLLVPVATVSSGAGDLMQLVKDALESLS